MIKAKPAPLEQEGITSDKKYSEAQNITETIQARLNRLDDRNSLQALQRAISPSRNMRNCSLQPVALIADNYEARNTEIKIKTNEFGYGFSGLATCDNPFCLFCSKGRAIENAEKIKQVLINTRETHSQFFTTFTIPRQRSAKTAIKDIQARWKKIQDKLVYMFKTSRKRKGLDEIEVLFCKAVDVTFSNKKGKLPYHVHLHCIVIIEGEIKLETINQLVKMWITKTEIEIQPNEKGQLIEKVFWGKGKNPNTLSKYIAKMSGLGLEIANGNNKTGKDKNSLSLIQLMKEALKEWKLLNKEQKETILLFGYASPEWITKIKAPHIVMYQTFLFEMKGARTISFSRNFKTYLNDLNPYEGKEENKQENEIVIPLSKWEVIQTKIIDIGKILYFTLEYLKDRTALEELEKILEMEKEKCKRLFYLWLVKWHVKSA